jgi:magnesium transporter
VRSNTVSSRSPERREPHPRRDSAGARALSDDSAAADEVQAEQDALFLTDPAVSTSPARSPGGVAARLFYRQSRANISDTSVDSHPALIDHRNQQHTLSVSVPQSSEARRRSTGRRRRSGNHLFDDGTRQPVSESPSATSPIAIEPSSPARQPVVPTSDLLDDAVSISSGVQQPSPRHRAVGGQDLSRAPSNSQMAEEDVCFPHFSLRDSDQDVPKVRGEVQEEEEVPADQPVPARGLPGVLANFPFPFDFGALDDFASKERERNEAFQRTENGGPEQGAFGESVGNGNVSFPADLGQPRRRGMLGNRQRKLSESVPSGRYQRKLAQFEGSGGMGKPDAKTPLLGHPGRPGFGAMRQQSQGSSGGGAASSGSEKEKPYRFSFYSNALSNTIHARSLAELPADGQSFQDLFMGPPPTPSPSRTSLDATGATAAEGNGHQTPPEVNGLRPSGVSLGAARARGTAMRTDQDAEANTWWLDVLCPTDTEMKVLSRVCGSARFPTSSSQPTDHKHSLVPGVRYPPFDDRGHSDGGDAGKD